MAWVAERFKISKFKAAWTTAFFMVVVGLACIFSERFFVLIDQDIVGPIVAPLSALVVVLFTGWRLNKDILDKELGGEGKALGRFLMIFVKYVAPIFMFIVLLMGIYQRFFV